ncbi:MAG: glycosyl hydrolase family 18 protein [Betaproteobacteria bacterium]
MAANPSPLSTLMLLAAYLLSGGSPANPASGTPPQTSPAVRPPAMGDTFRLAGASRRPRYVLGYYAQFSPDDRAAQDSLTTHRHQLTSVAPLWYSLSASGTLVRRGYDHAPVRQVASQAGLPVLALVTNSGMNNAVVTDPHSRARAIETLHELVRREGLGGVNIDFEGLKPAAGAAFTAFVRELAQRLRPEGYLVTVAVPARRTDDPGDDWTSAYDYGALGKVADYLVLMAYDQHWQTGTPGPVAALWWVEDVVRYAVARVPAKRLLLGLAGYGYDWSDGPQAQVVPAAGAERLAVRHGVRLRWDETAAEATFTYWQGATRHTVWVENSYSVEQRLPLVAKYGLAGVALWRLGQEEDRLWQILDRFRNADK